MAVKYEYYEVDDDTSSIIQGANWRAMTFTLGTTGTDVDFNLSFLNLKVLRSGSPGTVTVSIRNVDSNNKPTGNDLSTGTIDGDALTTTAEWQTVSMSSVRLLASTQYAIVVRAPDGDTDNTLLWRYDNNDGAYTGGDRNHSADSGASWTIASDDDMLFEVWGVATLSVSTFVRDVLFFIKDDLLGNVTDPISAKRGNSSKFVMTSFPEREVKYPLITIKMTNQEATRAGMQTTAMDVVITLEIRIWARNQKEKDELFTDVYDRLRNIQFTDSGSIDNNLHDFQLLSAVEVDEEGEKGIKSRIGQFQYKFFNVT